jgi:peptide/nickel transport system substrate-binding protein
MTSSSKLPFQATALRWPALAAVAVLGLSACSVANSDSAGGGAADTVRVVLGQEPPTLEACESNLTSTGVVVRSNVTEPLIERNPQSGELEPKLATEWKATSDREWTLKLREGVNFQDGTPFNAEAAAFTIDRR